MSGYFPADTSICRACNRRLSDHSGVKLTICAAYLTLKRFQ